MKPVQQVLKFNRVETVNIHPPHSPEQSKDEILKTRITHDDLRSVDAFCRGRGITRSEYVRELLRLDDRYFDLIETLNARVDVIVPMVKMLPKKI